MFSKIYYKIKSVINLIESYFHRKHKGPYAQREV